MKNSGTIIKKELSRVFGDKKMIFSLFLLPPILVIGIYSLIGMLAGNMSKDIEEHIPAVYMMNAPADLTEAASQSGYSSMANIKWLPVDTTEAELSEIKDQILGGSVELLVEFDAQFTDKIMSYQAAGDPIPDITIYYNTTGNYSQTAKNVLQEVLLNGYEKSLLQNRLGNLELLTVYNENEVVIVNEDKANGEYLSMMLPYLITFLLFASAMGLCVDAIAGEKERGTMASLLLTPIKRSQLVFGKIVSLSILASISALAYALSMLIAMPMMVKSMTGGESVDTAVSFTAFQVIGLIMLMITMVYLYVAVISLVSVIAKNAKEANTYVTPLYMLVLVAGMITMFQGGTPKSGITFMIPVYGSALSIQNLMTNELTITQLGFSIAGNVVAALLLTVLVTRAFNSEKVMFNA